MASTASKRLLGAAFIVLSLAVGAAQAQGNLENPAPDGSESGIGLISGWYCTAGQIQIGFDGGSLIKAAYGTSRGDTASVCGDTDNGFGLLYNYNLLGTGTHTVRAYADGVLFATRTFTVATLGGEFIPGLSKTALVPNFPGPGQGAVVSWQESKQNFVVKDLTTMAPAVFDPTGYWVPTVDLSMIITLQVDSSGRMSAVAIDNADGHWEMYDGQLSGKSARLSGGNPVFGFSAVMDVNFSTDDSATVTTVSCNAPPGWYCQLPPGASFQMNKCSSVGYNCL
jgi:hypothetical protein